MVVSDPTRPKPVVLIIDDEPGVRESLRMVLKSDYDATAVGSAAEALGALNAALPDVVLESVKLVAPDAERKPNTVGHAAVKGLIGGHIRFELLLPDAWNGRFVMGGGGGFVGTVQNAARYSVNLGYATIVFMATAVITVAITHHVLGG